MRWDAVLRKVLPLVDFFLPSIEEVLYFLERDRFLQLRRRASAEGASIIDLLTTDDYSRLSERLIGYGAGVVALKSGHRGIYVRTAERARIESFGRAAAGSVQNWADRELWEPAYYVERVASATGSGDCAIAGFLAAFVRGESVERTLQYATAAGAQNVMVHDAISGIKPWEETTASLESMAKAALPISGEGWRYDASGRRWRGPDGGNAK